MTAPTLDVPRGNAAVILEIPLDAIEVGANVRADPGELEGLAASIRELGVLQPVKAVEHPGGRYRLVWGQRRFLASQLAGLKTIPAIVVAPADIDSPGPNRAIEQLVENLDRRDLNPIEEARALREVLDANAGTLSQAALAERLGRSPSWLSNSLRLLGLADEVQEKVRTGEITASHGKAIAALPAKQQHELARIATSNGMSAHDLEREIQWKRDAAEQEARKVAKTEKWIPKAIAALEAAAVAKDVDVAISGSAYDVDVDAIRKAVKAAGWNVAPTCSCGKAKVAAGEGKFVCTNPEHDPKADRPAEPEPVPAPAEAES